MATHVVSVRIPQTVDAALRSSARNSHRSKAEALEWLVRISLSNFELLRQFPDCPGQWNSKLDVRIPAQTCEETKRAAEILGISFSVYIRRLLFHFYITKRIRYAKLDGRYTLAGQP